MFYLIAYAHSAGPGLWMAVGREIDAKNTKNRSQNEGNCAKSTKKRSQMVQKSRKVGKNQFWRVVRRRVASRTLSGIAPGNQKSFFLLKIDFLELVISLVFSP